MFLKKLFVIAALTALIIPATAFGQVYYDNDDDDDGVMSISYIMGGAKWYDLDDLNDIMDDNGYGTFDDTFGYFGIGMKMGYRRFMSDFQIGAIMTGDEESPDELITADLAGVNAFLNLGISLLSSSTASLYPYIGIGGETLALSLAPDTTVTLDELLADPGIMTTVSTSALLFNFGLGGDWLLPLFETSRGESGLNLGFRAGYMWAPNVNNFKYRDLHVEGELVDLSGPYAAITIGWGKRMNDVDRASSTVRQLIPLKQF